MVFSDELVNEFVSVAQRKKFRKYFSEQNLNELIELLCKMGELVKVTSSVNICQDPKDDFLLNLVLDSKADYLITGDQDLLVLEKVGTTEILSLKHFVEKNST